MEVSASVDYQAVVEAWYRDHHDRLQRMIGGIIHRKGQHGEERDEMRAELNYWIFRHVDSAARRGKICEVVLSMTLDYAYRSWASGRRSYHDRQGRHDLSEEATTECNSEEWRFPVSRRPNDPAMRARFHLDMQTIGRRLSPKAQRVLREFIKDPHATDKRVCEALGTGWRIQYVFAFRQKIKKALAEAGYHAPSMRRVEAPPEIAAIGQKAVSIYGACQRTPRASYMDVARRLGCQRSHVRWALQRFLEAGVPWAGQFMANNAQARCQKSKNVLVDPLFQT
jgi:hypothetical protein